jgi:DeoR family transcriptional regulator, fructose operon transcriptional repressor
MLTPERHQLILKCLKEKSPIKIQELVDLTNSSESTIRRDLTLLEQENFLKRIHGGAALLQGKLQESSMLEKSAKNLHEKKQIAKYAASLIEAGDCIYLDAGTTAFEMVEYLPEKIVVVTNGINHVPSLLEKGIVTFLLGGLAKQKTMAMIGRGALLSLENYRFDKCFIGVNGIHSEAGYTTPDQEEAMIKQKAIRQSREVFVLADESKFAEIAFAKICELHEAEIITNPIDLETLVQYQDKTNIKVVTA